MEWSWISSASSPATRRSSRSSDTSRAPRSPPSNSRTSSPLGACGPPYRCRGPRPERTYLSRASGTSRRRGCGVAWSILRALGACDGSSNLPSPTCRGPGGKGRMASQSERQWHRKMAAELFNSTWDLIAKKSRTKDEDDRMIHMAYASRYHWSVVGGPKEATMGEWQISHVYALRRRLEPA